MSSAESNLNKNTAEELRAAAAHLRGESELSEKDTVIARIQARRRKLVDAVTVADAEAALAELQRRSEQEQQQQSSTSGSQSESGQPGAVAAGADDQQGIPVEARLLPAGATGEQLAGRPGTFPRSATMRLIMRHPALALLGAGLLIKAGPARLLLLSRLALPFIKK